ncbi:MULTISPECIES: hypothetical protein [Bradyrhizobium]|uniref:Uncharacterized protein n=2 Tax=Bradyrhizobium ottawaense TaxID=931866 RepID=A0ABV4FP73_9BRAD|nr:MULTISPECIES: hypothetical protein [Bradyrhizobium]BBO01988.1 hypothetical protein SG09_13380 [Bradyrhizobium ottawaense]GMO49488.1 hypothetical protein BwSF21_69720 [Bradyrhizobium ottawaense]GMO53579.1 hypothetical protein BwSF12_65350 [Bradyrhizobium ottawaense]GMO53718.1 hypothetical protein BwSH14_77190 [Bradyrhizobium ottawaense]GMO86174.1 hypothetical protein BwSG20_73430 [Bradyrhizobium ottawaense]
MAGKVVASQFTGAFAHLNVSADITATRADIIRSLLTVGYPSRKKAIRKVGPWRTRMLSALAIGYLDRALRTTEYFRNLEQTEKVGVSFLLGQAFTHWFAQDRMDIPFLVHVAGLKTTTWGTSSAAVPTKTGASTPSPKSRPDFIGVKKAERHVFESKGRIRRPSKSAVAKALGQVSALRAINGSQPATRCATFFMLKASGAEGQVVDPAGAATGVEVKFDEWEMITNAYAFFLDGENVDLPEVAGEGYVGREIDNGVFYAIDKKVLSAAAGQEPASASERQQRRNEVFEILEHRAGTYRERHTEEVSPGPDGTLLIDRRPGGIRPRRKNV